MALQIVATGTGRCATKSVGMLFYYAGMDAHHENAFQWGGLMPDFESKKFSHIEMESSYMAAPFLDKLPESVKIIHLIRHPFRVAESIYHGQWWHVPAMGGYNLFVHNALQSMHDYDGWDKYVHYVIGWNEMIEPHAHYRFRIDKDDPHDLLDWCGIEPVEYHWQRYNAGKREHPRLEREYIQPQLWDQIIEMCERYGYDPCE